MDSLSLVEVRGLIASGKGSHSSLLTMKDVEPNDFGKLLGLIIKDNPNPTVASLTTQVILAGSDVNKVSLLMHSDLKSFHKKFDFNYMVELENNQVTVMFHPVVNGVVDSKNSFKGLPEDLVNYLDPFKKLVKDLHSKEGKIIRFKYNGGSDFGATRIIRLDSVISKDNEVTLRGIDFSLATEVNCWRTFKLDNIDGQAIEILN